MEILLVVVAVVGLFLWLKRSGAKVEAARELRTFNHHDGEPGDNFGIDWDVDFVAMTMVVESYTHEWDPSGEPKEPATRYTLRRRESGAWQSKITEESRDERLGWLVQVTKQPSILPSLNEARQKELRELDGGPGKWKPLRDDIAGPLESQYQRFIVHYRE